MEGEQSNGSGDGVSESYKRRFGSGRTVMYIANGISMYTRVSGDCLRCKRRNQTSDPFEIVPHPI